MNIKMEAFALPTDAITFFERSQETGLTSIAPSIDLQGKTIVISGCADGIGRAFAEAAMAFGAKIVGVDIQSDKLDELKEKYKSQFVAIPYDLSDENTNGLKQVLAEASDQIGRIDSIVFNAGIQNAAPWDIPHAPPAEEKEYMARIQMSHEAMFEALEPKLIDGARVVATVSGVIGRRGDPRMDNYAESKETLEAWMEKLLDRSGNKYIFTTWSPPPTDTVLRARYMPKEPVGANPFALDTIEIPLRLASATLSKAKNGKHYCFVDERDEKTTAAGEKYKAQKRTPDGGGFLFKITERIINTLEGTKGDILCAGYSTHAIRCILGEPPAPPVNENLTLAEAFPTPPYLQKIENFMLARCQKG